MRLLVSALAVLLALSPPALAQALPHHVDPGAREIVPNLTAVPTIRFLTTADFPPFNFLNADGRLSGASPSQSYRPGSTTTLFIADAAFSPFAQAAPRL